MSTARFAVDLPALRLAVDDVARAGEVITALREHPGVLAGRAADAGDDALRDALVAFGADWDWGWRVVGGEAERWAALLTAALETYATVEQSIVDSPWVRLWNAR